jgi:hypothetical protein
LRRSPKGGQHAWKTRVREDLREGLGRCQLAHSQVRPLEGFDQRDAREFVRYARSGRTCQDNLRVVFTHDCQLGTSPAEIHQRRSRPQIYVSIERACVIREDRVAKGSESGRYARLATSPDTKDRECTTFHLDRGPVQWLHPEQRKSDWKHRKEETASRFSLIDAIANHTHTGAGVVACYLVPGVSTPFDREPTKDFLERSIRIASTGALLARPRQLGEGRGVGCLREAWESWET